MRKRITNAIYSDYLYCPYKAYLKITGKKGKNTAFNVMQDKISEEYKVSTSRFLLDKWKNERTISNLLLSKFRKDHYTRGINIREVSDRFNIIFDGLIKEPGSDNDLVPVILTCKENLAINDKLDLAFCGFALGIALGEMPSFGRIIHGLEHTNTRIKLDRLISRIIPAVNHIESFATGHDAPQMHIGKHCQVCEFGAECWKTAVENDDLRLGM